MTSSTERDQAKHTLLIPGAGLLFDIPSFPDYTLSAIPRDRQITDYGGQLLAVWLNWLTLASIIPTLLAKF